jgi:hypothetical protein
MDTTKFGKDYIRALKSAVPSREFPAYDPAWLKHWEETLVPHAWTLLQKDDGWFQEPRECIPGINFSEFWSEVSETDRTTLWTFLQMSVLYAFLDGDTEAKFEKLLETVKSWWSGSGQESDEISKLLEDEETPGQLKALFDAVLQTRLVKVIQETIAELDLKELGIDVEHPEKLMEAVRPDSPLVKRIIESIHAGIERRIRSGHVDAAEIQRDIERIRALVQQTFGKVLNEQLFGGEGNTAAIPQQAFLGTGPEARRQRMLARLQKKQREKNSGDHSKR